MVGHLVVLATFAFALWLIRRDEALRAKPSSALWIPTLWVGFLASRPPSSWIGGDVTSGDSLEGNSIDRLFYLVLIGLAFRVLIRRRIDWNQVFRRNWAIFVFMGYLLVSVLWAEFPFVSFKRWFKEFGNIIVVLVILTEKDPLQAFKAVFTRCGYLLIPLSYVFIRWFSELGRRYSPHTGELEAIGVTTQKNNLGALVLICGLVICWDLFDLLRKESRKRHRLGIFIRLGILFIGTYLLYLCDSKTSMVCLVVAILVMVASRFPPFKTRPMALGGATIALALSLVLAEWLFGIKEAVVTGALKRDMTFTGRTAVWRELLALETDPIIGTGYLSFWSDQSYQERLPKWVAYSAHNGYLEVYIDGGWVGVFFLVSMLLVVGRQILGSLASGGLYAVFAFGVYIAVLIDNFSESYFARLTPLGFLFLLIAVRYRPRLRMAQPATVRSHEETLMPSDALPSQGERGAPI